MYPEITKNLMLEKCMGEMRLWKCEFCGKWDCEIVNFVKEWDFEIVNCVKNDIFKMWIFG